LSTDERIESELDTDIFVDKGLQFKIPVESQGYDFFPGKKDRVGKQSNKIE
jgi:hypothetical protein